MFLLLFSGILEGRGFFCSFFCFRWLTLALKVFSLSFSLGATYGGGRGAVYYTV